MAAQALVTLLSSMIKLPALDEDGNNCLKDVLCFARYSLNEIIVIAVNMCDTKRQFLIDFGTLLPTFL